MTCEAENDGSGLAGKFSGGACRPEPAMVDGLIATMLINEDLPSLPNRTFVIAPSMQESIIRQSWVSQLQLAESQSCMQLGAHGCFCTSGRLPEVSACLSVSQCNANAAWRCNAAADPMVPMLLSGLLREHVPITLVQWAMAAGFVQSSYARRQDETEMVYAARLVQLLVEPLARYGYNDDTGSYGVLRPTDPLSAAYAHTHDQSCPANWYGTRGEGRIWGCLPCPDGTESPPGSTVVSDCTKMSRDEAAAVAMCASQHADCTDGCRLMLTDYWTDCNHACERRCSNCVRTADNTTAEVAAQCGSTGTDARLPAGQGLVSFLHLPPPPRLGGGAEDWRTRCLTAGDCVNVEIDVAAPNMSPLSITAMPPDSTRGWRFFSPQRAGQ